MTGIRTDPSGTRRFSREFRVSVLESLNKGLDEGKVRAQFGLTVREIKRILAWKKNIDLIPSRRKGHEERIAAIVEKDRTIRERLYEKAVSAVSDSLNPIETLIENNPVLTSGPDAMELLPTVVGHERNRGQNAIKVLEGLGDFRRAGDDVVREGPRQPLFNLPPGSHVAVRMEITTGEQNASSGSSKSIVEAEAVDTEV